MAFAWHNHRALSIAGDPIPLFFFNLRHGPDLSLDDTGIDFPSLELAYLDAFRAAGEIWHEMTSQRMDASDHTFEIMDGTGRLLIELPFAEALSTSLSEHQSSRAMPPFATSSTHDRLARSAMLAEEIAMWITTVRDTIDQSRRVLRRARASSSPDT